MVVDGFEEYIKLKLVCQNTDDVNLKVSTMTKMDKLKKLYMSCQGLETESLRFLFNGRRINGDVTPWNLDLKDGDVIEVFLEKSREITIDDNLFIKLLGFSGERKLFKIKYAMRMANLRKHLSESLNTPEMAVKLQFEGRTIFDDDTPWSMNMKENDEIEVSLEPIKSRKLEKNHVVIKVIGKDDEIFGAEAKQFIMKSSTSISRLIKYYSNKGQIPEDSVRFLFKGLQINGEDTPERLEMKNDDVIEVFCDCPQETQEVHFIKIKALYCDKVWFRFKVKPHTKMRKFKKTFGEIVGVSSKNLRFLFLGVFIRDDDTPEKLELKDNMIIEVVTIR